MTAYVGVEKPRRMTKQEALEDLRQRFHTTRLTPLIHVPAEVVAALLGYND